MAVKETVHSRRSNALLDNGTTTEGAVKTISLSIGTLGNPDTWDAQKAYNIVQKLSPCLSKSLYTLSSVTTAYIGE